MIDFTVESLPPSVNGYWRVARWGGRYVSADGVAFKKLVQAHVHAKNIAHCKLNVQYSLYIEYGSPNWITKKATIAKVDVDNFAKCALDSLCEALFIDDSQIFDLHMKKIFSKVKSTRYVLEAAP